MLFFCFIQDSNDVDRLTRSEHSDDDSVDCLMLFSVEIVSFDLFDYERSYRRIGQNSTENTLFSFDTVGQVVIGL